MGNPPYPPGQRNRDARRNIIKQDGEWVRRRIYNLEDDQINALIDMLEVSRREMENQLLIISGRYGGAAEWSSSDVYFRERTDALMKQIGQQLDSLIPMAESSTLAQMEQAYKGGLYGTGWITDQALRGAGVINLPLLPTSAIHSALLSPYGGLTFTDRYAEARDLFVRDIRRALVGSQIEGDSIPQAIQRLADALGLDIKGTDRGLAWRLEMIARTEILRASNLGAMQFYESNADILQGWEFIATNDERTCEECGPLDGTQYAFGEGDVPPLHPNCRCSALPVLLDSDLEQRIVGPRQTWSEWAADNGVDSSLLGE